MFEETSDMAKLSLERVIIWSVLLEQLIVVLAVFKQVLICLILLEVGIAILTYPSNKVTSRSQWCTPLISK